MFPIINTQNNNVVTGSFSTFFQDWLIRQEQLYYDLVANLPINEGDCDINSDEKCDIDLTNRVIIHYAEYYSAKSQMTRENVFSVLAPTWLTVYERTFLWIGGFKPGLAFRIAKNADLALDQEQEHQMELISTQVVAEEAVLMSEFARLHELITNPIIVAVARRRGRVANGEINDMAMELERAKAGLVAIVECADRLRMETTMKVMGVLRSRQKVRFLTATAKLQLTLRSWGLQRARRV